MVAYVIATLSLFSAAAWLIYWAYRMVAAMEHVNDISYHSRYFSKSYQRSILVQFVSAYIIAFLFELICVIFAAVGGLVLLGDITSSTNPFSFYLFAGVFAALASTTQFVIANAARSPRPIFFEWLYPPLIFLILSLIIFGLN